jgi:hypothetical protein
MYVTNECMYVRTYVHTSEMLALTYETTRHQNPKHQHERLF